MVERKNSEANIKEYADKITIFLTENKDKFLSELQIAQQVFGLRLTGDGSVPKSSSQMEKLVMIRKALKFLMEGRKIKGSLFEDPHTKESVMHYSMTDQRVLDLQ